MISRICLILLTIFVLSSCTGDQCIDADDFGFTSFTISARYAPSALSSQIGFEVAPWIDNGYQVNGDPLTIMVRNWSYVASPNSNTADNVSAWCPWYGDQSDTATLSDFCQTLAVCKFASDMCTSDNGDAEITNAPCILKQGVGLYGLITESDYDPNASFTNQQNPTGIVFHVGAPTPLLNNQNYKLYDVDMFGPGGSIEYQQAGGLVYDYSGENVKNYTNGKLYFKILDKFYDDNSGQYRVVIKSGIFATDPDPITYITNKVKDFFFGTDRNGYGLIQSLYSGIVTNPAYTVVVSTLLTLYVMFTAFSYLTGNINITTNELVTRLIKIAIVSALLRPDSWDFFYNYLFVFFVGGLEEILNILNSAGATGASSSGIVALMVAPQTLAKLFSLLLVDWLGFIYIILFIIALYFVLTVFFEASVIYLTTLITVGMMITLAPIFICFLLFGITRPLFDNWLRQIIGYTIQPIILFAGLAFLSLIISQEIYGALGFRVCKSNIFNLTLDGGSILRSGSSGTVPDSTTLLYWWFPNPLKGEDFSQTPVSIPIPIDHFTDSTNTLAIGDSVTTNPDGTSNFCSAYACVGQRYVDLPFLDPVTDTRRLQQFWNGQFVQLDGMLLIFVAIFLMQKFNVLAVSIANFISSSGGNSSGALNMIGIGKDATKGIMNGTKSAMQNIGTRLARTSAVQGLRRDINQRVNNILNMPSKLVDEVRVRNLKKEALSPKANKLVLDEVKRQTGLSQPDIKPQAISEYKKALQKYFPEIDPKLSNKQLEKIASNYGNKASRQELLKALYNKGYDNDSINKKINETPKNIKDLADQVTNFRANVRKFQDAYVDAYKYLSEQGVSLIVRDAPSSQENILVKSAKKLVIRYNTGGLQTTLSLNQQSPASQQQLNTKISVLINNIKDNNYESRPENVKLLANKAVEIRDKILASERNLLNQAQGKEKILLSSIAKQHSDLAKYNIINRDTHKELSTLFNKLETIKNKNPGDKDLGTINSLSLKEAEQLKLAINKAPPPQTKELQTELKQLDNSLTEYINNKKIIDEISQTQRKELVNESVVKTLATSDNISYTQLLAETNKLNKEQQKAKGMQESKEQKPEYGQKDDIPQQPQDKDSKPTIDSRARTSDSAMQETGSKQPELKQAELEQKPEDNKLIEPRKDTIKDTDAKSGGGQQISKEQQKAKGTQESKEQKPEYRQKDDIPQQSQKSKAEPLKPIADGKTNDNIIQKIDSKPVELKQPELKKFIEDNKLIEPGKDTIKDTEPTIGQEKSDKSGKVTQSEHPEKQNQDNINLDNLKPEQTSQKDKEDNFLHSLETTAKPKTKYEKYNVKAGETRYTKKEENNSDVPTNKVITRRESKKLNINLQKQLEKADIKTETKTNSDNSDE